jgi:hypothetical protein
MSLEIHKPGRDAAEENELPVERMFYGTMEFPTIPEERSSRQDAAPPMPDLLPRKPRWGRFSVQLIFGVILPLLTLGVELETGMCASEFFDPIPTIGHIALVLAVPLINLLTLILLQMQLSTQTLGRLRFANSFAFGISIFYALLFLPLTPLAVIALVYGIGILPLSPLLSCLITLLLRRRIRRTADEAGMATRSHARFGLALGLGVLLLAELPSATSTIGLRLASSESAADQATGLMILRTIGSNDALLRACYQQRRRYDISGIVASLIAPGNTSIEEARSIYYRINGKAFNSAPPPSMAVRALRSEEFDVDADQGSEQVGSFVRGLGLSSSRIDAAIDADAALSYTEWTMIFGNRSDRQHEARMLVALPPGAVISRVTLWINGEEREAAFGGRAETRAAYSGVVQQRRDPVLVSTVGVGRVLVQCFPVPARGEGTMKIRIGITAPLVPGAGMTGRYIAPSLLERNFKLPEKGNEIWLESKGRFGAAPDGLRTERTPEGSWRIRGTIGTAEEAMIIPAVTVERSGARPVLYSTDRSDSTKIIRQTITHSAPPIPRSLTIVVDASAGMEDAIPMVAKALEGLPEGLDINIIAAEEEATVLMAGKGSPEIYEYAADLVEDIDAAGGRDNLPALERAWDRATTTDNGAILWIHAAQPVELRSVDELLHRYHRSARTPEIYELQIGGGRDRILESLDRIDKVHALERSGDPAVDIERAFAWFKAGATGWRIERERIERKDAGSGGNIETGPDHIARLWAADRVRSLARSAPETATEIAVRYQLVTPVTGAVVLETEEQYQSAGLTPVSPGSVPTVPEPETWAMMIVAALMLGWTLVRIGTGGGVA